MAPNYDFNYSDLLSKILKHPRLRDYKYGSPNPKRIAIGNPILPTYYTDATFLKSLLEKYGDISFGEALEKWRKDKQTRDK